MSPEPIDITVELDTHIQLATLSLRRQVLRSVIITNHGDDAISGLELELESDPGLIHAKTIRIEEIGPSEAYVVPPAQLQLNLNMERLAHLTERQQGTFFTRPECSRIQLS